MTKDRVILRLLAAGPKFGQEIVDAAGGTLARGTVYVWLKRLEELGFITSDEEPRPTPGALPRRRYAITEAGRRALAARPWTPARAHALGDVISIAIALAAVAVIAAKACGW